MRVELKGEGEPIPTIALPDPNLSDDLPPIRFLLTDDGFDKTDWVGLGYTNFEVYCIGAAGGKGGDNPSPERYSHGGAGGGGGLHYYAGLLADLDTVTPVTVGDVGADGQDTDGAIFPPEILKNYCKYLHAYRAGTSEIIVDNGSRPMVAFGVTYINGDGSYVAPWTKVDYYGTPISSSYPWAGWDGTHIPRLPYILRPNPSYLPALAGQDGGYSAFGSLCMASGGKGGLPSGLYEVQSADGYGIENQPGGDGGAGGSGGTLIAGGGGAGGWTEEIWDPTDGPTPSGYNVFPAVDGGWDGVVGYGGGGGRGGGVSSGGTTHTAQNGAQGSFSFGDTSKFGPKQLRTLDPVKNRAIVPGGGGGAKLSDTQIFGGRSTGADPNGAVVIRVFKVE